MNKTNNQTATYSDSTMMEHTLYHVESLYVALHRTTAPIQGQCSIARWPSKRHCIQIKCL